MSFLNFTNYVYLDPCCLYLQVYVREVEALVVEDSVVAADTGAVDTQVVVPGMVTEAPLGQSLE